jgi:hypothetical protein
MKHPVLAGLAAVGVLGASGPASAAVTGRGLASLTIEPAAGISVTSSMSLPSVTMSGLTTVNVSPSTQGLSATTVRVAPGSIGNAALTVTGQAGDAVSMAVPESFRVIRTGGTETLTVQTNTNLEYALGPGGVAVGSALNADMMSVHVGGALNLASADAPPPGAYEGFLMVVVQYN